MRVSGCWICKACETKAVSDEEEMATYIFNLLSDGRVPDVEECIAEEGADEPTGSQEGHRTETCRDEGIQAKGRTQSGIVAAGDESAQTDE